MAKRRYIDLLPARLRSEDLTKFFSATIDHVFQPGRAEHLTGFIGDYPEQFDPTKDFYKPEITPDREYHQLVPTMVSGSGTTVDYVLFYQDLVDHLRSNGAITGNESRLFSGRYYSWSPPVDLDKLNNFQCYYWFTNETDGSKILEQPIVWLKSPVVSYEADGTTTTFAMPPAISGLSQNDEFPALFVNDEPTVFTRNGNNLIVSSPPADGAKVEVYRYGDLKDAIEGREHFDPRPFLDVGSPEHSCFSDLTTGLRVGIIDAQFRQSGWDIMAWDTSPWDNYGGTYIVDGVGIDIRLSLYSFDTVYPNYTVVDRRAANGNPWARKNRWVHRSSIEWTGLDYSEQQAKRPILEFDHRLELWRYGRQRGQSVDCVLTGNAKTVAGWDMTPFDTTAFDDLDTLSPLAIDGKPFETVVVDNGHYLKEGDILLIAQTIAGDSTTKPLSNQIVEVQGTLNEDGVYVIALSPIDRDTDGEIISIGDTGQEFFSNDGMWRTAQTYVEGEAPLFWLYDGNGVRLDDPDVYPVSTFFGNRVFGYARGSGNADALIGHPLRRDANGQIVFENDLHTKSYAWGLNREPIVGYGYYRLLSADGQSDFFGNDWHLSDTATSQEGGDGVFEIPRNLQANPDNEEVEFISRSEWFEHFNSIMSSQDDFSGVSYSINNWRDTARELNKGTRILQHRSPLLRTMLLSSDNMFNLPDAVRFCEQEYVRFRSRFIRTVVQFQDDGRAQNRTTPELVKIVLENMRAGRTSDFPFSANRIGGETYFIPPTPAAMGIFKAHTPAIVFDDTYGTSVAMLRGHDGSHTVLFGERVSYTYESGDKVFLLSEEPRGDVTVSVDGVPLAQNKFELSGRVVRVTETLTAGDVVSLQVADIRDQALLALETMIYQNLDSSFKTEIEPFFNLDTWTEGKFREFSPSADNYSIGEFHSILAPMFLRWAQNNQLDPQAHVGYNEFDPFTWNYSTSLDAFGDTVPCGHWRGLYRWLFGTDQPHTQPWQMLGFAQKPSWWNSEYGAAPYTRTNNKLWGDLKDGRIRQGPRAGVDSRYARSGLLQIIPVDAGGALLNPIAAGIIPIVPTVQDASAPWKFGDGAPVEALWRASPSYPFALTMASYLMKPARFVEATWETLNTVEVYGHQRVHRTTMTRPENAVRYVHGELSADGTQRNLTGLHQFICEHMSSLGQSPSLFGAALRGLSVRLAHKFAGFTSSDTLRVMADNFGLLPPEDVTVAMYASPSKREEFYSGVIVEWNGSGYQIFGYNSQDTHFLTIPSDQEGPSVTVALDGVNDPIVVDWKPNVYYKVDILVSHNGSTYRCLRGHTSTAIFEGGFWKAEPGLLTPERLRVQKFITSIDTIQKVPYGTTFYSIQDVADFLFSYERYLTARGWIFDNQDEESGAPIDWTASVREFLNWAKIGWAPGNFIALSPAAEKLKFNTDFGTVYSLEETTRGSFGIVDRSGMPIARSDIYVGRLEGEVTVRVKNNDLFGLRLHIGDVEHVLVFSNTTIFGDTVYKPLLDLRQSRLKLIGQRAQDWVGRMDAPGYVLVDNTMLPSFDKSAEDIRYAFEIENADNETLRDHARHLIGYETRDYMRNLLISDTQQFEFYQGMIHQKGSPDVFNKLLRSQFIGEDRNLKFLEEWAFKIGSYGSMDTSRRVSFDFRQSDYKRTPQAIRFYSDSSTPEMIYLEDRDYIERPLGRGDLFKYRRGRDPVMGDLPTAGFVRLTEVEHTVFQHSEIESLADKLKVEDRIWVYEDTNFSWSVKRVFNASANNATNQVKRIVVTDEEDDVTTARVYFVNPHGLTTADIGRKMIIRGETRTEEDLAGIHNITAVGSGYVDIDATARYGYVWSRTNSDPETDDLAPDPENAPTVLVLRDTRFVSDAAFQQARTQWLGSPKLNEYVYLSTTNGMLVKRWDGSAWVDHRSQPMKIDPNSILTALIYGTETKITDNYLMPEPLTKGSILVFDPVAGQVPGEGEKEITYKLEYDPAKYSGYGSENWGPEQVGVLWWDISKVRYLEAETDTLLQPSQEAIAAEFEHRVATWGKIAPGTRIAVYEWVRSLVLPNKWSGDGKVLNENAYITYTEFDPALNRNISVYYFWVEGTTSVPALVPNRKMSAASVARILENPSTSAIPWIAPISGDCVIVNGVEPYLDDHSTTIQIEVLDVPTDANVHTEWTLMREGDERSVPSSGLWNKLVDSVIGMNDLYEAVPDTTTHVSGRQGISNRPRQSLFSRPSGTPRETVLSARETMVGVINRIFARSTFPEISPEPFAMHDTWGTPVQQGQVTSYYLSWTAEHEGHVVKPSTREYDYEVFSIEERNRLLARSSFRNSPYLLRVLVNGLNEEIPHWTVWEYDPSNPVVASYSPMGLVALASSPTPEGVQPLFKVAKAYDKVAATSASVPQMSFVNGERLLIRNADGFWSLWKYLPASANANSTGLLTGFVFLRCQTYRTSDFIERTDWFAEGYERVHPPAITYNNMTEVMLSEKANPVNTFVKVLESDYDKNRWSWMAFRDGSWQEVARERGTYALLPTFYDPTKVAYGRTIASYDNRDGGQELRRILDEIWSNRNYFSRADINEVFFAMVHFAHAHCDQVNWAFKTSFLHVTGYNEIMDQSPVQSSDKTAALLDYIDEVKPYRVKTRNFSRSLSPPVITAEIHPTDFDKPVYVDQTSNQFRTLKMTTGADIAMLESQMPWSEWYANRDTNKIRRITSRVVFDRIDTAQVVNPITKEAFNLPSTTLNRPGHAMNAALIGAGERIDTYYEPVGEMAAKNLTELLDLGFRGTVASGDKLAGRLPLDATIKGTHDDSAAAVFMNPMDNYGHPSHRIADPYHSANRPEELAHVYHHDTVYFKVKSNGEPGAPLQTVKFFEADSLNREEIGIDTYFAIPFHEIAQSNFAVAVFRDGIRAAPSDVIVNHFKREVHLKVYHPTGEPVNRVAVHVFGIGGTTKILEQRFYTYVEGQPQTFAVEEEGSFEAEIVVNGIRAGALQASNKLVTIPTSMVNLNDDDQVMLVIRQLSTDGTSTSIRVFRQDLAYSGNRTMTLTWPPLAIVEMIIEVDGLRLIPTTDFTYDVETVSITLGDHVVLTSESVITVTSFRNCDLMDISTEVFSGNEDGEYEIDTPSKIAYMWVTVNGRRLIQGAEFEVNSSGLKFKPGHQSSDKIIVTTFMGEPCEIGSTFIAASIKSGKDILQPISDGDWDVGEWDMGEWDSGDSYMTSTVPELESPLEDYASPYAGQTRVLHQMGGGWEYVRVLDAHTGLLANDLEEYDGEIVVKKKPQSSDVFNVDMFRLPQPDAPGVVWINGERIEYSRITEETATLTLRGVRRGTRGTKIGDEQRAVAKFTGNGSQTTFVLNGATDKPLDGFLVQAVGNLENLTPLVAGIDYTVDYEDTGAVITMAAAPNNGANLIFTQTIASHVHRANTQVIGASVRFVPSDSAL